MKRKETEKMKKIFKKALTAILAMAMVMGMLVIPTMAATTEYYIVGAGDVFGSWTPANAKKMTESSGVYTYTFTSTANTTYEFQILPSNANWAGQIGKEIGGNFGYMALTSGTATITFDPNKSGDERISVTGLVSPNPANDFYVVGINDWTTGDKMTESSGVYTYTYSNLDTKATSYKVAQDFPTYGWYKAYPASGNFDVDISNITTKKMNVTITYTATDNSVTSVASEVAGSGKLEEETTTANETATTAANSTTTAANTTTTAATTEAATTVAPTKSATTTVLHVKAPAAWSTVNLKFGVGSSWDELEGYEKYKSEDYGVALTDTTSKDGYLTLTINVADGTEINGLLDNGAWGDGNQTKNFEGLKLDGSEYYLVVADDYTVTITTSNPADNATGKGTAIPFAAIAFVAVIGAAVVITKKRAIEA